RPLAPPLLRAGGSPLSGLAGRRLQVEAVHAILARRGEGHRLSSRAPGEGEAAHRRCRHMLQTLLALALLAVVAAVVVWFRGRHTRAGENAIARVEAQAYQALFTG